MKTPSRLRIPMSPGPLIALVCAIVAGAIWWVTLQRVAFERRQAVAAAMESNAHLAIAFEQQAFRMLKAGEQVAAFVREQYLREGRAIDLNEWVKRRVIREPMFTIVSVVDEAGEIVASSQPTGRINYADRAFFKAHRDPSSDAIFVSQPVLGRVSGRWQIPMSLRMAHPDGRFAGVVVLSVDPASFTEFYGVAELGSQGMLELTGLDGVVRGRKIGSASSFGLRADTLPWFQRRAVQPEGAFVDDGRAVDDVVRVVSYRTLAGYPLMVAVGTAEAAVLAPEAQRRRAYLAFAAAMTLALLALAGLLALALSRQRAAAETLRSSAALFRATFDQAAMGIAHFAPDGRILRVNEKFCRMLGMSAEALRARTVFELGDADHQNEARQFVAQRLAASPMAFAPEIEKPYRRQDGSVLWVCEALGLVKDAEGRPDFLVAVTQDITARMDLQARLSHEASHDALTSLPNRAMFQDRFGQVLRSARRHGRTCGVLYIDLDGFKSVNDVHGHAVGDELLQQTARRLESCIRAEDTVARLGGDEFGVVLATLAHPQDCEAVAAKIILALATPFELEHQVVNVSASIGAALFPQHGSDDAVLLARADAAMYVAKNTGKNRFSWDRVADCES